jgi:hypothetical protein
MPTLLLLLLHSTVAKSCAHYTLVQKKFKKLLLVVFLGGMELKLLKQEGEEKEVVIDDSCA